MQNELREENARALLQLSEQQRQHWSRMITTLLGFTVITNAAIWSFFAQSLAKFIDEPAKIYSGFIMATALSAITVGVWRWYTSHIDNQLSWLYPEIMRYEMRLSVPRNEGLEGYLSRGNALVGQCLSRDDLTNDQRIEVIRGLVGKRRIGTRGHLVVDMFALAAVLLLFLADLTWFIILLRQEALQSFGWLDGICFLAVFIGFALTFYAFWFYQREPSKKDIDKAISELKG